MSPDKRGPIVLGYGYGEGQNVGVCNESEIDWLDKLCSDIEYRWYYPNDYYDGLTEEEIEAEATSLLTWRAIRCDNDSLSDGIQTKGGGNLPPPEPEEPPGHYEMVYSYITETPCDSIGHLLITKWGQRDTFNLYCPFEDTSYTNRCPAGCVNIAGGQVLYYLHYYFGVPTMSPTTGYCIGYSHYDFWGLQTGYYVSYFDNYAITTWDNMVTTTIGNETTALFIGSLGALSDTEYDASGSSTTVKKLVDDAFSFYGINSSYSTNYSTSTVYQNILNGIPVIFGGNRYVDLFNWPGHAWVIDGYVSYSITTHFIYDWVYDDPDINLEEYPLSIHDSYETTSTYSSLRWFNMNWGYRGSGDDRHYSTDGIWTNPVNGGNPYQYNIQMAYGFTAL